jgi:hypothetical protein
MAREERRIIMSKSTLDLKGIAAAASSKQALIILKNAELKSTMDLKGIAAAGNGCVVFDFS